MKIEVGILVEFQPSGHLLPVSFVLNWLQGDGPMLNLCSEFI